MERSSHSYGFLSSVMTFIVVTVMSLLVWIYAESRTAKPLSAPSNTTLPADSPMLTFELAPVPVVLSVRAEEAQRYSLSLDESEKFQTGVTLSGPPWLVEQVLPLGQSIRAYVEVTAQSILSAKDGRVMIDPIIRGVPKGLTVHGIRPVSVIIKPIE